MPVKINGSTSGSTTITAPATGTDETIELSTALAAKAPLASPNFSGTPTLAGNPLGKVLQVVQTTYNTTQQNNTSTFADTGLSATITPKLATSKVLVFVNQAGCGKMSGNVSSSVQLKLLRGTTEIHWISSNAAYTNSSTDMIVGTLCAVYLDSPATTSATTYKTQFANRLNAVGCKVQWNTGEETSSMTLIEIAA